MTIYLTGLYLKEKAIIIPWSYDSYVILTLYHNHVILILILILISTSFFASNQIFNNYLFYLFYKAIVYFTILWYQTYLQINL